MGTNQFQTEYIEYLQERNTELLNRLNNLKETYENKILAKNLSKHYLISALEDVLNVCTAIPQEIDLFFDKMTAAVGAFKNILLRKSEMMQLAEKISKMINLTENVDNNLISMDGSDLVKEQISEGRVERKAGTVKVSPMINGHIISTEPRIYLSRVPGVFTPGRKNETHQLSPIIEASPDPSSDPSNTRNHIFREIKIPLERINLNKMSYNYISEESPKSRFKGPKTWKKSLSSNKCKSDCQKNTVFRENDENLDKKFSVGEVELSQLPENIDPLEGPSWLHEEISELNSSSSRFIDYRRRKHRFATVFDKNEDCITYFEENSRKSLKEVSNEFYENFEETDDEKNIEENKKRVNENSVDFICESFTSECEDNDSFKRRKFGSTKRVRTKESNNKNCIEFVDNIKEFVDSKNEKGICTFGTPTRLDSSHDEDNEKNSARQSKEDKKRYSKSSCNKNSMELCFDKIPHTTKFLEQESRLSKRSRNKRGKNTSVNQALKNDIKLENHVFAKEFLPVTSEGSSPIMEKKSNSKAGSNSRGAMVYLYENEFRKRRKAAPSFKLAEPKLNTKLRRS